MIDPSSPTIGTQNWRNNICAYIAVILGEVKKITDDNPLRRHICHALLRIDPEDLSACGFMMTLARMNISEPAPK